MSEENLKLQQALFELERAIELLRGVGPPSFRGGHLAVSSMQSAQVSIHVALGCLGEAFEALGLEPAPVLPPLAWNRRDPGRNWGQAMDLTYRLLALRERVRALLISQGERVPQDLAEPGRLERMLQPVPRGLLPFLAWVPTVIVCALITAASMVVRHAGWLG